MRAVQNSSHPRARHCSACVITTAVMLGLAASVEVPQPFHSAPALLLPLSSVPSHLDAEQQRCISGPYTHTHRLTQLPISSENKIRFV